MFPRRCLPTRSCRNQRPPRAGAVPSLPTVGCDGQGSCRKLRRWARAAIHEVAPKTDHFVEGHGFRVRLFDTVDPRAAESAAPIPRQIEPVDYREIRALVVDGDEACAVHGDGRRRARPARGRPTTRWRHVEPLARVAVRAWTRAHMRWRRSSWPRQGTWSWTPSVTGRGSGSGGRRS